MIRGTDCSTRHGVVLVAGMERMCRSVRHVETASHRRSGVTRTDARCERVPDPPSITSDFDATGSPPIAGTGALLESVQGGWMWAGQGARSISSRALRPGPPTALHHPVDDPVAAVAELRGGRSDCDRPVAGRQQRANVPQRRRGNQVDLHVVGGKASAANRSTKASTAAVV
jgi:hypothetical protein